MSKFSPGSRDDVVRHLRDLHGWNDVRKAAGGEGVSGGAISPDPLGWHNMDGGYLTPTSELLRIHTELAKMEGN